MKLNKYSDINEELYSYRQELRNFHTPGSSPYYVEICHANVKLRILSYAQLIHFAKFLFILDFYTSYEKEQQKLEPHYYNKTTSKSTINENSRESGLFNTNSLFNKLDEYCQKVNASEIEICFYYLSSLLVLKNKARKYSPPPMYVITKALIDDKVIHYESIIVHHLSNFITSQTESVFSFFGVVPIKLTKADDSYELPHPKTFGLALFLILARNGIHLKGRKIGRKSSATPIKEDKDFFVSLYNFILEAKDKITYPQIFDLANQFSKSSTKSAHKASTKIIETFTSEMKFPINIKEKSVDRYLNDFFGLMDFTHKNSIPKDEKRIAALLYHYPELSKEIDLLTKNPKSILFFLPSR